MIHFLLFLTTLFLFNRCRTIVETKSEIPQDNYTKTIQYKQLDNVDANLLSLDIYYKIPTAPKKPVVVYVHGVAWSIGDKSKNIENKINLFQSQEYVFVSVNYRLSPFPYQVRNINKTKHPAPVEDVADAVKWIKNNISEYGGDANNIALLGHSAGSQIVSLLSTNQSFLNNVGLNLSDIKGIASIDTEGYNVKAKVDDGTMFYINAFGTDKETIKQASALYNIENGEDFPKFFISKRGKEERLAFANEFIKKLEQNGADVTQLDASEYSHISINNAIGKPEETHLTNALLQFFEACFQ